MGRGSNRMSDWVSRKQFRVTNSLLSAATDYQIRFQVYRSTGTDTATDVYIGTNCQEDFSDIRWTDSTGIDEGLYEYWIESPTTSAVATCWVKMRYLPANSATTVYLYYNNPNGVSAYSSGSNTFPFFDDFPGSALDTDKWSVTAGTPAVSSGVLTLAGNCQVTSDTGYGVNYAVRSRMKSGHYNTTSYSERFYWITDWNNGAYAFFCGNKDWNKKFRTADGGSYSTAAFDLWAADTYKVLEIIRNSTTSVIFNVDDVADATISTNIDNGTNTLHIGSETASGSVTLDWILFRKYLSTEPTVEVVESGDTNTTTTKAYRIVGLEFDQDTGLFTIEFGAVEDYYMSQDAKYRGAYDTSLSLM